MSEVDSREYAAGIVRSYKGIVIMFSFGSNPKLLWNGKIPTRIDSPERFGKWETEQEQKDYVIKFYSENVIEEMR